MTKKTLNYLHECYGPLIPMDGLAKLFDRSKEGLRVSLSNDSEFSKAINKARTKYGRRVFFKSSEIAKIIDEGEFSWARKEFGVH